MKEPQLFVAIIMAILVLLSSSKPIARLASELIKTWLGDIFKVIAVSSTFQSSSGEY
jgi:hypothetical protein